CAPLYVIYRDTEAQLDKACALMCRSFGTASVIRETNIAWRLWGINNRNLADFSVDLQTTCKLMEARRKELEKLGILVVSESGIHGYQDVNVVKNAGVDAVLIGESLMKKADPGEALLKLFSE
ncbi:MAG: hypothetical protein F6K17_20995, partial [Okeania sp. SIO3C4]|nr:hypothetical protein [Okeania sp. SIO3C4]